MQILYKHKREKDIHLGNALKQDSIDFKIKK